MKDFRRLCFLLAALLAFAAPKAFAQDEAAPESAAEVAAPAQAVSVEPVARDSEIAQRIKDILKATDWYENTRVRVDDGVVFLDGVTATDERRAWARDLALKTQDVATVVNRIQVEQEVSWSFEPAWRELQTLGRKTIATLPLILLALVILPLAWLAAAWVSRMARRLLAGRIESPFLADVISRIIAVPVFLLGLYVVLQVAGLTRLAVSVIGGAGVLGIIVGFAFRDIAENFLASLLLSIRRPFRAGDFIEVCGEEGIVQSMNTRSTVLLSAEGNHIQIPNAAIFKNTITNYSAAPNRRDTLDVGIGYDVPIAAAQEVISGVLARHEAVLNEPAPLVLVDSLGGSTVNLKSYYWVNGRDYSTIKVKSAILRLVKKALIEGGISMPDEAREIIFPQGVPILGLEGGAADKAGSLARADLGEAARMEQEAAALEPDSDATDAEGDLGNERAELEEQAAVGAAPEEGSDLLGEKREEA